MYDLIILGGGPAALATAMYAQGNQLDTLVICETIGGKAGARQRLVGQLGDEYLAGEEAVQAFEHRIMQSDRVLHDRVTTVGKQDQVFHVVTDRARTTDGSSSCLHREWRRAGYAARCAGVMPESQEASRAVGQRIAAVRQARHLS